MNPNPDIPGPPARVLIVDDERTNRELLELMLAPEGLLLETAASGEEALAVAAQQPPDLILLDLMMPDMDGYRVTKQIKRNPATKNIGIIILTALYDHKAKMLALGAGAQDFLTKPVDRAELCMRVRNLLHLKAYGDFHHRYGQMPDGEGGPRTAGLIESEILYRSTFDAAPVGIAHTGLDGQWLRVNQRLCDLLGYSRNELLSSSVQELMQSEEEEMVGEAESFHAMASGTQPRHVVDEKRYRRRDGSFVWARLNMSVHRDAEGQSKHFISVIEDITTRRPPVAA
jgi:PAS domain S-box-containing protein